MKRIIFVAILLASVGYAQDTGQYCEIVGINKIMSAKLIISIDYGNGKKPEAVKEDDGKYRTFRSMVEALNYMDSQGWEFVTAYTITIQNQNVYHYLLKKKSPD